MAHAQLLLSGKTTGSFVDLAEANTTVTNTPDGSYAKFSTGIPFGASTQSSIEFSNDTFTDVGYGEPIQVGLFTIVNGRTLVGTGAPTAQFNLGLELTSPAWQEVALSTITFNIDHTPNSGSTIPDQFSVSFNQPAPLHIGDYLVQFHVHFDPTEFVVGEDTSVTRGDITVTFTPVPEPSTYAAFGAALLVGVVAYRRFRGDKNAALPAAA
ncbi:MAG TPA: choice-of-anchor K domain-containing protein [Opitutus sp.]|nr:choice-of-anchor K domain-containing protein [Opitutus sp.]